MRKTFYLVERHSGAWPQYLSPYYRCWYTAFQPAFLLTDENEAVRLAEDNQGQVKVYTLQEQDSANS